MRPTSASDRTIRLYLTVFLVVCGTDRSGKSAATGSTAIRRSKAIFTSEVMCLSLHHVETLGQRPGQIKQMLGAKQRDEVLIGQQAAQGVDDEEEPALAHRRPLDHQLLPVGLPPIGAHQRVRGYALPRRRPNAAMVRPF